MTHVPGWIALAALTTLALASRSATAQTGANDTLVTGTGDSYSVNFSDDPLNALGNDAVIARIVVRPGAARTMLLRPRTSYVSEMLKSVEGM